MDTPLPPSNPMYNHPLPLPSTSRTLLPRSRATSLTRSVSSSASASQSRSSSVVPGRVGDRERERIREGEQRRLRARVRARVREHERASEMETGGDTEPEGEMEADDVEEMNVGDVEADTEIEDADEPGPPLTQLTEVDSSPPQRIGGRGLDMGMRTIAEESWSQLPAQMSLDRDLSFAIPHPRPLQPADTLHDIPFEISTQPQTHMETDTRPLKRKRTASDDGQDEAEERGGFTVPSGSTSRSGPSMTTGGGPGSSSYVPGMMGGSSASIGRLRTGRMAMGGPADSSWSEVEGHLGRLSDFISSDEEDEEEDEDRSRSWGSRRVSTKDKGKGKGKGKAKSQPDDTKANTDSKDKDKPKEPSEIIDLVSPKATSSIMPPDPIPHPSSAPPPTHPPPENPADLLSEYTCPICFFPPSNATATPCGHVCCGACLFTAVKAGVQRGRMGGGGAIMGLAEEAKCPVCRATIPGWDGKGGGVIGLKVRAIFSL